MDNKDQLISQLRAEIYQLKKHEATHRAIDQRISQLQTQYALAFDEKQRFDKEQKHQLNEDSAAILDLKREIDLLKTEIERLGLDNQEKANEIVKLKKMADARAKDIQLSKKDCITLENKNRTLFEGNKEVALAIRAAKQERQDIENDIEAVEDIIARNVQMLRAKEKENRQKDVELVRLRKQLQNMRAQLAKLQSELGEQQALKSLRLSQIEEKSRQKQQFIRTLQALEAELDYWNQECQRNQKAYEEQAAAVRELTKQKATLQAAMREKEIAIDQLKIAKSRVAETKSCLLQDNMTLNDELQKNVRMVRELMSINEELQREIASYSEEDEAARKILDRKSKLRDALKLNGMQLQRTMGGIEHLLHHPL